jgi:hypothetical protein
LDRLRAPAGQSEFNLRALEKQQYLWYVIGNPARSVSQFMNYYTNFPFALFFKRASDIPKRFRPRKKTAARGKPKAVRLPGVFVIEVSPDAATPHVEKGHYFQTSLEASKFLGFASNVVGRALRRAELENKNFGRAVISGIEFETVNRAYQSRKEIDFPNAHPILSRHFPWLFREGSVICNSEEVRRSRARFTSRHPLTGSCRQTDLGLSKTDSNL